MRLKIFLLFSIISLFIVAFNKREIKGIEPIKPNVNKVYNNLVFQKEETLKSAGGTKSVLFNSTGTKLYAMNLEGLSVYNID